MRIEEALERYYQHQAAFAKPSTRTSAKSRLGQLCQWLVGQGVTTLEQITPEVLDRWAASLQQVNVIYDDPASSRPPMEKPLSKHTIDNRIRTVKAFLNWCHRREYIEKPAGRWLKQLRLDHQASQRLMQPADLRLMLAEAERRMATGHSRDLAIIMFAADTGARRGEIASLTLPNLNLAKLDATVIGKTGSRLVDFTTETRDVIRLWLQERPDCDNQAVFVGMDPRGKGHEPLTHHGIYQVFRRIGKAAGVSGRFNPQALRHLVGQTWTDHVNLELVRQKLGHSSILVTSLFYAHQDRTRVKAATQLYTPLGGYKPAIIEDEDNE